MSSLKVDIIIIGNQGCGKTSLVKRFVNSNPNGSMIFSFLKLDTEEQNGFTDKYDPTIGYTHDIFPLENRIKFERKVIKINDNQGNPTTVNLHIWDTAGQEKHFSLTKSSSLIPKSYKLDYFRKAQGVIVVYDITDSTSFLSLEVEDFWIRQVVDNCKENIPKILVGNKKDLSQERTVSTEEGQKMADSHKIDFFETSAKSIEGVHEAFHRIAQIVFQSTSQEKPEIEEGVILDNRDDRPKGFRCWDSLKQKFSSLFSYGKSE